MKNKRGLWGSRQLVIVAVAVVIFIAVTVGLTVKTISDSMKEFSGDGYVLVPSQSEELTTDVNEQYYFSSGTKYREKFGQTVSFKDTSNQSVTTDTNQFIHYLDGSLAAFSKGVVMSLADVAQEQVTYYNVSDKTTILKNGRLYQMSYMGDALEMEEFLWKLEDDRYMLVTPRVTLHLSDNTEVVLDDYIQLQYVAGGIVRLVHQQGTYQTVADTAYLTTDSGIQLNLMDRSFMQNGVEVFSLDDMVIDSSANLNLDEDEEGMKIPSFNVVNGTNGTDGGEGEAGTDGEEGASGEDGVSGSAGEAGQDGFDGQEGDSGDWGYDGKDGASGENAEHSGSNDGIASIQQPQAPRVSLDTDKYSVGPNSVGMNLLIDDPNSMLQSDLRWTIYSRSDMVERAGGIISRGVTSYAVSNSALLPDTEYVMVVSGTYATDVGVYDSDFFTKIFKTDTLGLSLEKVQVTENSITVKTAMTEDALVGSYQIALYDESGNNISKYTAAYSEGNEFVFDETHGLEMGVTLEPDSVYTVKLVNVYHTDGSVIASDLALDVTTLKRLPYYEGAGGAGDISVQATPASASGSDRYKTISVTMDSGLRDPDKGIRGYRYELYKVSTVGADPTGEPDAVKEVETMQTVNFDAESDQSYVGRVVVLFHDNEKNVELPSAFSPVTSLSATNYPVVSFMGMERNYDSISGYIMVNDTQGMLLDNISSSYPLVLTMVSEAADPIAIRIDTAATPPAGSVTGENIRYYYFYQDGLRRNTKYSLSVSGPVNDTGLDWGSLTEEQKQTASRYYLAGVNVDTGDPATLVARFRSTNTGTGLFSVNFGLTSLGAGDMDATYETANLEKVSFRLINTATGETIGNEAVMMDSNDERHDSDFSNVYSVSGTPEDQQSYSSQFVLTDASFGAEGDSRIAAGGMFAIVVNYGYDYTQKDTYPDYTNEMDWDANSVRFEFEVQKRHTILNPNEAVTIQQLANSEVPTAYEDPEVAEDIAAGLKITPDYRWSDATSVTYYIYKITDGAAEPLGGGDPLTDVTWSEDGTAATTIRPDAVKTVQLAPSTSPGSGKDISPWTVYFTDTDADSPTANLDNSGNKIFERGQRYFVRYVVTTDGSMSDTASGDKYPDCVYSGYAAQDIPYYRSQIFDLERQTPVVQRYLWNTVTSAGVTTQTWKYRLTDPDGAVLAAAADELPANVKATVMSYDSYEAALAAADGTGTELSAASLAGLYSGTALKDTYETVDITGLADDSWYTVKIPYQLFEGEENSILELPVHVRGVASMKTDILTSASADPTHQSSDYKVDGLMVKGIGTEAGIKDDYGYRIRLTLQGDDIFRVSALRVTLTANNKSGVPTTVVYDPVQLTIVDGMTGNAVKNSYGYAYLDYAPIVQAGINSEQATITVEAYYDTYQAGMKSFTEYTGFADSDYFGPQTENGGSAWALKFASYTDTEEGLVYSETYQKAVDDNGTLQSSQLVSRNLGDGAKIATTAGSVILPTVDDAYASNGFSETDGKIALRYTLASLCTTERTDADKYSDVRFAVAKNVEMDDVGMAEQESGSYLTVERLELKQLQIDCGEAAKDFKEAAFYTGDGMPGIKYAANSSIGMKSAALRFETKGAVPNDTDKGMYVYLYEADTDTAVPLEKYRDADGNVYYLPAGGTPTSPSDSQITATNNGLDSQYGMEITYSDTINGTVEFNIRDLKAGTKYYAVVKAKDTNGTVSDLFDYQRERGGYHYEFTTTSAIQMTADAPAWLYSSYNSKHGQLAFAIKGSEGTGMRIYYRLYDGANNEITWGSATGNSYNSTYGYLIEPLGDKIKYYHSDKAQNNPVNISFKPGLLQLNTSYKVVMTAYATDNDGNIIDATPIGTLTKEIRTPNALNSPRAAVRVVPGKTSLAITTVMTDTNKVIINDQYTVQVIAADGTTVSTKTVNTVPGQTVSTSTITVDGLNENTPYTVKVTAKLDKNNDGANDNSDYVTAVSTATVSSAAASVTTSYTDDKLVLTLRDRSNFDEVKTILYSIDSDDGATHYEDRSVAIEDWTSSGGNISYNTGFALESGASYSYTIQYYDVSGKLLGTTSGYFSK